MENRDAVGAIAQVDINQRATERDAAVDDIERGLSRARADHGPEWPEVPANPGEYHGIVVHDEDRCPACHCALPLPIMLHSQLGVRRA